MRLHQGFEVNPNGLGELMLIIKKYHTESVQPLFIVFDMILDLLIMMLA